MKKKVIAGLLVVSMTAGLLTGCGASASVTTSGDSEEDEQKIKVGETISPDSKWIDSDIEGAIDESTPVNLKDDFYTYENRDWMLSTEPDEVYHMTSTMFTPANDALTERLLKIFSGEEDPNADGNVEISQEEVDHDAQLVATFAGAAADWDARNSDGVTTLQKYTDYIEDIDSVDDLRSYILDEDCQNLYNLTLSSFEVTTMTKDAGNYYLNVESFPTERSASLAHGGTLALTLGRPSAYMGGGMLATFSLVMNLEGIEQKYGYILERLGYTDKEAKKIIKNCLKFECKLVDHMGDYTYYYGGEWDLSDESLDTMTRDEIKEMEGNYPLKELIDAYGYDTDKVIVMNPKYIKYLGQAFNEKNLEEIKDYLILHTVESGAFMTDRECYDKMQESLKKAKETEKSTTITVGGSTGGDGDKTEKEAKTDEAVLIQQVRGYLAGCMDTVYVARYCKTEDKEAIQELTETIVEYYHQMIDTEDWLTEDTREYVHEKLDAITRNILYPDNFISYDYLELDDDMALLDMVAALNQQKRGADAYLLGMDVDHSLWDFDMVSTTDINAYYMPSANSINILAGYIAGGSFSEDMSIEEKLGNLGAVIGHEITHAFDTNGCKYDKDGNYRNWWAFADQLAFTEKANDLQNYYNAIIPYPGADHLTGTTVSGEAIADMGGLKCMLGIAKEIDGFDYDLFFRSYEKLWAMQETYDNEKNNSKDVHPLNYLRGNVTVMQFQEFYDTYDIQPGDGMYLAPDKRIAVW